MTEAPPEKALDKLLAQRRRLYDRLRDEPALIGETVLSLEKLDTEMDLYWPRIKEYDKYGDKYKMLTAHLRLLGHPEEIRKLCEAVAAKSLMFNYTQLRGGIMAEFNKKDPQKQRFFNVANDEDRQTGILFKIAIREQLTKEQQAAVGKLAPDRRAFKSLFGKPAKRK